MLEKVRDQLRNLREQEEARLRYEANEMERQKKLRQEMERTDEEIKSDLERAGISVSALEEEDAKSLKKLHRTHEELLKIEPPPQRTPHFEPLLTRHVESLLGPRINPSFSVCTTIYPPAYDGLGVPELCNLNLDLGEINSDLTLAGSGWANSLGIYYYCLLWFYYFPPSAGELYVWPYVDFQGNVAVSADDRWYTSTHAELRMRLHFDLYQHYWDGDEIVTIIDEHRHNSSTAYWLDRTVVPFKSLSVSAHDIVWIKVAVHVAALAKSKRARVDCDFRTGANRRIRVQRIRACLHPLAA